MQAISPDYLLEHDYPLLSAQQRGLCLCALDLAAPLLVDAGWLARLLRRFQERLVFGNLDVLQGRVPVLDGAAWCDDLLIKRRAGYCYQLNGLLSALLASLGCTPRWHLSRVVPPGARVQERPRSHLVLTLDLAGKTYLLDAGFGGGGLCEPLLMEYDLVQDQGAGAFVLRQSDDPAGFLLARQQGGKEDVLFWFDRQTAFPADCAVANHFAATAPHSLFRQHVLLTRLRPDGARLSLFDRGWRITHQGEREEFQAASFSAWLQVLQDQFSQEIDLDAETMLARMWASW